MIDSKNDSCTTPLHICVHDEEQIRMHILCFLSGMLSRIHDGIYHKFRDFLISDEIDHWYETLSKGLCKVQIINVNTNPLFYRLFILSGNASKLFD